VRSAPLGATSKRNSSKLLRVPDQMSLLTELAVLCLTKYFAPTKPIFRPTKTSNSGQFNENVYKQLKTFTVIRIPLENPPLFP
jgi:hypothetical protein